VLGLRQCVDLHHRVPNGCGSVPADDWVGNVADCMRLCLTLPEKCPWGVQFLAPSHPGQSGRCEFVANHDCSGLNFPSCVEHPGNAGCISAARGWHIVSKFCSDDRVGSDEFAPVSADSRRTIKVALIFGRFDSDQDQSLDCDEISDFHRATQDTVFANCDYLCGQLGLGSACKLDISDFQAIFSRFDGNIEEDYDAVFGSFLWARLCSDCEFDAVRVLAGADVPLDSCKQACQDDPACAAAEYEPESHDCYLIYSHGCALQPRAGKMEAYRLQRRGLNADYILDSTLWRDEQGHSCAWYAVADPTCSQLEDVGQFVACSSTCQGKTVACVDGAGR
jgi:hypothetical protein